MNADTIQNAGESGIGGVTVTLIEAGPDGIFGTADDVSLGSQTTAGDGSYSFPGLSEGTYRVEAERNSSLASYVLTTLFNPIQISLVTGQVVNDADFGYAEIGFEKTDPEMWSDLNQNGILDVGDIVTFDIIITNPSQNHDVIADILDMLPPGLAGLDYLSVPAGADISESHATMMSIKNVQVNAGSVTTISLLATITVESLNGEEIVNNASADFDGDGITDKDDDGITSIVTNIQVPPPLMEYCGETFIITTEAGNGLYGHSGDNGPATSARLWNPTQICLDQDNNMYIADYSNHVVRKVEYGTGIITTVAGIPNTRGYSGDGGPATSALLALPSDVWVRGSYLYIAEMGNNVIRKVNLETGEITTVAGNGTAGYSGDGGPATAAQLNRPRAVYVDVAGNIYIGDTFNFVIRMVSAADGVIQTIAGTGVAGHADDGDLATNTPIEWIHDIVMSSNGTLYFSEQNGYNLVRRIINGRIWTVSGREGAHSIGDCGPATDAYLKKPYGLAFDTYDNLYIADEWNHKIRKIEALTGYITTIAGTGVPGYNGDNILGIDAQLNHPTGVAVGPDNILHIADRENHRIRRMDLEDPTRRSGFPDTPPGEIRTIAGNGTYGFIGDSADARLIRLNYPGAMAIDPDGNVIFADRSNHRIRKVATDWSITTIAGYGSYRGYSGDGGPAWSAQLNFPSGVALDAAGNIYVSDQYNHAIRKIDVNGIITTIAGNGTPGFDGDGGPAVNALFDNPDDLAILGSNLYISDKFNNRVRVIDLDTGIITTVAGNGAWGRGAENVGATTTPLDTPRGIDVAPDGTLYITASGVAQVKMVTPGGIISTIAGDGVAGNSGDGGPAILARMRTPTDVALAPGNVLYVADYRSHVIRRIDLSTGIITRYAGTGYAGYTGDMGPALDATFNYPQNLAVNYIGDLFVADRLNHVIRVIGH